MTFDELVERAFRLTERLPRVLLGITGPPGSGKSTLAEALVGRLNSAVPDDGRCCPFAAHVPMDGFHLADSELSRLGLLPRKGAPETFDSAGYVSLLRRLRVAAEPITYAPAFERDLEQPLAGAVPVRRESRVVVTEGNYLLLPDPPWGEVHALLDDVWFCEVGESVRRRWLVDRHRSSGKSDGQARRWVDEVDEQNAALIAGTRGRADLVVPVGELWR